MPRWGFSAKHLDPERTAIAVGRDVDVSYKATVEVLREIRGKNVSEAKRFLEEVIAMKRPVRYRRYVGKVGHRKGRGFGPGRYPVKVAKEVLKVIQNAEANAEYKGFDTERLWIVHAAAHKGLRIRKYMPRAFGRATPWFRQLVHIEIGVEERPEGGEE